MFRPLRFLISLLAIILVACAGASNGSSPPTPTATVRSSTSPTPGDSQGDTHVITIWAAPQFDPASGTPAGDLFQSRLEAFEAAHPGVAVNLRTKATTGDGGLLQSLSSASIAAPQIVPDIITLDDHQLNAATVKGHLVALDGLFPYPIQPDWLPPIARMDEPEAGLFGIPFASNALVLVYSPNRYDEPPFSWSRIENGRDDFLFPAGDPQAKTSLALYLALGGSLQDENGRPSLDPQALEQVLEFYAAVQARGLLPPAVRQFTGPAESWLAYQENSAGSAVATFQDVIQAGPDGFSTLPLPTRNGQGVSLFGTWSWAVATGDADRQALAVQLINWLSEPEFLGAWTAEMGLIPPLSEALDAWQAGPAATLASLLIPVGLPQPSEETLATFGPPIQAAVTAVLNGGQSPAAAAGEAAGAIQQP